MELRRAEETTARYEQVRQDWILTSETFAINCSPRGDGQVGQVITEYQRGLCQRRSARL